MNSDDLIHAVYNDLLDVMATGRPTGSTEKLADQLRAFLGLPEWPTQETVALCDCKAECAGPDTTAKRCRAEEGKLETGVRCAFAGCEAIVEGAQVCGRHTGMWP